MGCDFRTPSKLCAVSIKSHLPPPIARRQGLCDTSIGFDSIKQGFSDLGFSGTPTVTPYPFARSMDCAFRTPSKLCAVLTGPLSFPLQGGK